MKCARRDRKEPRESFVRVGARVIEWKCSYMGTPCEDDINHGMH